MYACHITHQQRQKRLGAGAVISKEENHDYGQERDKRNRDSHRYNSYFVRIFDSIGIIKPYTSQNRALAGVGKATRKTYGGSSREADTMKVRCRRTRGR